MKPNYIAYSRPDGYWFSVECEGDDGTFFDAGGGPYKYKKDAAARAKTIVEDFGFKPRTGRLVR